MQAATFKEYNYTAIQQPIHSGFNAYTTADEVIKGIDLTGKTVIVTGGYSGLGKETVSIIKKAGATVIVPTRDIQKAKETLQEIEGIEIEYMDLLDPQSIDAFANTFLQSNRPLHLLINNAGIMANPFTKDARGYESQFATNHLSHFQLTAKLFPALQQANGARVIVLSSRGHYFSPVVFDDIHFEHRPYDKWKAYGQSKTANILFALHLDKLGKTHNIRAFSVHPGSIVGTGLQKDLTHEELEKAGVFDQDGKPIFNPSVGLKTVKEGAATTVWCATSPQLDNIGGVYCEDCDVSAIIKDGFEWEIDVSRRHTGVMHYAVNEEHAAHLWEVSEQLTGTKFFIMSPLKNVAM